MRKTLTWLLLSSLLGCAQLTMKPPTRGLPSTLPVQSYQPSNYGRDRSFRLGPATVDDVSGTPVMPPGLTAYGRAPEQDQWSYTFKLREGNRELAGSCTERAARGWFLGFGDVPLDVTCTCAEGAVKKAELRLQQKGGEARVADVRYAVWATRESAQARRSKTILGYVFRHGSSDGGIDVTRAGARAYLPQGLTEEQRMPLTCLYAALLLHRPIK